MSLWPILSKIIFQLEAEHAHDLSIKYIKRSKPAFLERISGSKRQLNANWSKEFFGKKIFAPLGLAAGFDKNAHIIDKLPQLGFGFGEIGTVTPLAQEGNPQPRLFRQSAKGNLLNRMGFNNDGAYVISERIKKKQSLLADNFSLGVNIGKNKETPNKSAHEDYAKAIEPFANLADYVVINVSSPNTPGLRDLQSANSLGNITEAVHNVIDKWQKKPALLLKLAPELAEIQLCEMIAQEDNWGLDGWIFSNTLKSEYRHQSFGLSGAGLCEIARKKLTIVRQASKKTIVSVGGIMSAEEAKKRFELGADFIQIYSGWIFNGPRFPAQINHSVTNSTVKSANS